MKIKKTAKILITFCLLTVLIVTSVTPAFAAPEEKENTVVMGYFSEPGMMNGAQEGALKSGYAYECMMEIAAHTGWRYRYVYGSFEDLYERFLDGDIDILPFISSTPERRSRMLFPDYGLADETFYLAAANRIPVSDDFHELNGKRIGSTEGYFQNEVLTEFIDKHALDCEIVLFDTPEKKWSAVENREVDISVESSLTLQPIEFVPICRIGDDYPIYSVISLNRPDLLEQFNAAQREIDTENPSFLSSLNVKYFKNVPLFKSFSERGKKWIEEHKVLRIGVFDNDAPLVYKDDDGEVKGVMPDYIQRMFKNYGIDLPVEWKFYSTNAAALAGLRAREIDVIHPYYPSYYIAEREGLIISTVVYSSPMGILYEGAYTPTTMNRVATPFTRLGAHYVKDNYPDSTIVPCLNGYDCIDKLLAGEADCVVLNSTALKKIAGDYKNNFNIKTLHSMCDTCFATLPENYAVIDIINNTAPFLDDTEVNAIEAGYYVESDTAITAEQFFRQHPAFLIASTAFIVAAISAMIFISYRRRMEKARRIAADAANKAKTAFLFNMSHDIRTPMNAILGYTDMGLRHIDDIEKSADSFKKIKTAGGHLLNLINDILEMSRIEAGKLELTETPMDIRRSVESVSLMSNALAVPKDIDFRTELGEIRNPYVYADELHANEVAINLISNAIKYTQAGGKVRFNIRQLTAAENGKAVYRFEFADNGIGMSEDFQKHLFESFSRESDASVSKEEGAGLGLAIVKRIVDLAGGTISVRSRKGEGSTFVIDVPFRIMDEKAIRELVAEEFKEEEISDASAFKGKSVLLVEDNEMNREIAEEILEDAGFEIESVEDGIYAIDMLKEKGPEYYDFVLMDIQMPVMNGYEATKAIREMFPDAHIPIIAVSANAFEEDKKASIAAGMDDHVAKPIVIKELFTVLAKYL